MSPRWYFGITIFLEARSSFLRKRKGYFSPGASSCLLLAIVVLRPKQKYMRSNLSDTDGGRLAAEPAFTI